SAMLPWHRRHRWCGSCGTLPTPDWAGHVRRCPGCGAEHFPRTDPVIIVVVTAGAGHCLLGRQAAWPPRMFSALAGFVEPGESLEDAVAREVREETGVAVTDVAYNSSQPWPFPLSLMLGFHASAGPAPVAVTDHPRPIDWRDDDAVLLAMKTQDTAAALDALAASAPASVRVICAQNGVENERLALRRFASVYGMLVILGAAHLEPGSVEYY